MAEKLIKAALSDRMEVAALVNSVTLLFQNIDPLTRKKELMEDIKGEWGISPADHIEVKTLMGDVNGGCGDCGPKGRGGVETKNGLDDNDGQTPAERTEVLQMPHARAYGDKAHSGYALVRRYAGGVAVTTIY